MFKPRTCALALMSTLLLLLFHGAAPSRPSRCTPDASAALRIFWMAFSMPVSLFRDLRESDSTQRRRCASFSKQMRETTNIWKFITPKSHGGPPNFLIGMTRPLHPERRVGAKSACRTPRWGVSHLPALDGRAGPAPS